MINGYIAKKVGMTQIFTPEGKKISVTKLMAPTLTVTQIKTSETKDKYSAIQFAYGTRKRLNSAIKGKMSKLKLDITPSNFVEFKLKADATLALGDQIEVSQVFNPGDKIDVTGTSKGHGFAGVIKRWGFRRQPVSGGQSDRVRAPGSIGAQTPGKVLKGKKMPGHFGNKTRTVTSLKIYSINPETREILVTGSVPGAINSYMTLIVSKHQRV